MLFKHGGDGREMGACLHRASEELHTPHFTEYLEKWVHDSYLHGFSKRGNEFKSAAKATQPIGEGGVNSSEASIVSIDSNIGAVGSSNTTGTRLQFIIDHLRGLYLAEHNQRQKRMAALYRKKSGLSETQAWGSELLFPS